VEGILKPESLEGTMSLEGRRKALGTLVTSITVTFQASVILAVEVYLTRKARGVQIV